MDAKTRMTDIQKYLRNQSHKPIEKIFNQTQISFQSDVSTSRTERTRVKSYHIPQSQVNYEFVNGINFNPIKPANYIKRPMINNGNLQKGITWALLIIMRILNTQKQAAFYGLKIAAFVASEENEYDIIQATFVQIEKYSNREDEQQKVLKQFIKFKERKNQLIKLKYILRWKQKKDQFNNFLIQKIEQIGKNYYENRKQKLIRILIISLINCGRFKQTRKVQKIKKIMIRRFFKKWHVQINSKLRINRNILNISSQLSFLKHSRKSIFK